MARMAFCRFESVDGAIRTGWRPFTLETGDRGVRTTASVSVRLDTWTVPRMMRAKRDASGVFLEEVAREDRDLTLEVSDREMTVFRCWPDAPGREMVGAMWQPW